MNRILNLAYKVRHQPLKMLLQGMGWSLLAYYTYQLVLWGIIHASIMGDNPASCHKNGACWIFVTQHFDEWTYGFYPQAERWRINIILFLQTVLFSTLLHPKGPWKKKVFLATITLNPMVSAWLLYGGLFGLTIVEPHFWTGWVLTLILAFIASVVSLPLGILLALARHSSLPVFKTLSLLFIETIRALPLVTLLFCAAIMFPLFYPQEWVIDKVYRIIFIICMFGSAYMAEVIRGGLQSLPKIQYEAAESMGLSYWQQTVHIVLPQVLQNMTPAIINTLIGLIKDTTLVYIIGLMEALGMMELTLANSVWMGFHTEGFIVISLLFWVLCYSLSYLGKQFENTENSYVINSH
ncbi:MAG TPA: amino acid ABC transporter permease [Gammaproteobacteria bacterium]|nr:amino acid ABC transporter permease [Gammaproteobacteria bacterium]